MFIITIAGDRDVKTHSQIFIVLVVESLQAEGRRLRKAEGLSLAAEGCPPKAEGLSLAAEGCLPKAEGLSQRPKAFPKGRRPFPTAEGRSSSSRRLPFPSILRFFLLF